MHRIGQIHRAEPFDAACHDFNRALANSFPSACSWSFGDTSLQITRLGYALLVHSLLFRPPPPLIPSSQLLAYSVTFYSSYRRLLQWRHLLPAGRRAVWRFYGVFAALACAGCVFGVVAAAIQLPNSDGAVSLTYYFADERVFDDGRFRGNGRQMFMYTVYLFSAHSVAVTFEFFFFSIAKIFVLHRLSHFIKLGLSNRAVKTFDFITVLVLATVFSLCCGALTSSCVAASYYASVGAKATVFPVNATASEISKATAYILDKGNDASSVQHYIMCSTIGAAFLALIASAAFALRGIRKTFALKKLSESADVRRVRNQIYAFCLSVFVSYMLQFWCAAASSPSRVATSTHVSHGNPFASYFMALLGSDIHAA
jgi:hypothetical protein